MSGLRSWAKTAIARHPALQYPGYRLASVFHQFAAPFSSPGASSLRCDHPVVIILGAGRSGNTLLRRLLMEQGRIYIPPESYVWTAQISNHLHSAGLPWSERVALALGRLEFSSEFHTFEIASLRDFALSAASWPKERQTLGCLIRGLYFWLAESKGIEADWVGDKTPMNVLRIGLIGKMFPAASFVYVERNAVDVALSYRNSGISLDVAATARRWKSSRDAWRRYSRRLPSSQTFSIRYEDLTSEGTSIVPQLLGHFGIPLRQAGASLANSMGDVTSYAHHQRVLDAVGPPTSYDWSAELSPEDRFRIRKILGRVVAEPGYETL